MNLERGRSYTQGMSQERKDEIDGERDALRVMAGLEPYWPLNKDVTPAYRQGWITSSADSARGSGVMQVWTVVVQDAGLDEPFVWAAATLKAAIESIVEMTTDPEPSVEPEDGISDDLTWWMDSQGDLRVISSWGDLQAYARRGELAE